MIPRCTLCPMPGGVACTALQGICDAMGDPGVRARYAEHAIAFEAAHPAAVAEIRAAMVAAAGGEVVGTQEPPPDAWAARIYACPDFNPGCCSSPAPYCSRFHINPTRDRCIACLTEGSE